MTWQRPHSRLSPQDHVSLKQACVHTCPLAHSLAKDADTCSISLPPAAKLWLLTAGPTLSPHGTHQGARPNGMVSATRGHPHLPTFLSRAVALQAPPSCCTVQVTLGAGTVSWGPKHCFLQLRTLQTRISPVCQLFCILFFPKRTFHAFRMITSKTN